MARFRPSPSEAALVERAGSGEGVFLAGVVFQEGVGNWTELPEHVHYLVRWNLFTQYPYLTSRTLAQHTTRQIRMGVDSVPRTSELKERMWVPGPDGDM